MVTKTNQHLSDDTLYVSPRGRPSVELRKMGDRLALYTEDNAVYKQFKEWKQLLYLCPYNLESRQVACDLYFPKSALKPLLRALKKNQAVTPQKEGVT